MRVFVTGGTGELGVVEREQDDPDLIVDVNPAHDLPAGADRAADEHLERRQHLRQGASLFGKDDAGAYENDARAVRFRCLCRLFPIDA